MTTVTVSPKFQVVIPKELRERMKLKPGQKLFMCVIEGKLLLEIPGPITELRGIAKGMSWKDDYRDRRDRF
jgi:AbrB family looped-hinge helix DNA binding protein